MTSGAARARWREHSLFPVDDAVVYLPMPTDETTLIIAALARKNDLKHHLELLGRWGTDPRTVTLSELAIARLLARSQTASTNAHLLMDIETTSTSMVLLDSDGTPRALRTVNAGFSPDEEGAVAEAHANSILSVARQTLLTISPMPLINLDVIPMGPLPVSLCCAKNWPTRFHSPFAMPRNSIIPSCSTGCGPT